MHYSVGPAVRFALVDADGRARPLAAPPWPRPSPYARTTTRAAGRWVLVTRVEGGRMRAALRRLT